MSEIFISYKREDEARVGRLVKALQGAGFLSIWWDRGLAGGENWRSQIENELAAARCVIVVWTHQSGGPAGDFVRDEAGRRNVAACWCRSSWTRLIHHSVSERPKPST
jgi:hypothetical protein